MQREICRRNTFVASLLLYQTEPKNDNSPVVQKHRFYQSLYVPRKREWIQGWITKFPSDKESYRKKDKTLENLWRITLKIFFWLGLLEYLIQWKSFFFYYPTELNNAHSDWLRAGPFDVEWTDCKGKSK